MDLTHEYPLDIDENNHARSILKKLDSIRRDEKNCDVIIRVEGKKIHVNRNVMCAGSDYFDAMFSHDTKENQEGVIEMKDVKFSAVEKCINFIYSGKLSISEDESESLLYCASLMQLNVVCSKIAPFLEGRLTPKSYFSIRRIAVKFSLKMLTAACDEFALNRLFELAQEEEFNSFDIDYLSFLLSTTKFSGHRTEDSKLAIALQWIKIDLNSREKYLMKIVRLLDTSKLTFGYSRFLVENESLCMKSTEFMRELFIGNAISHEVKVSDPPDLSKSSIPFSNSLLMFDKTSNVVQLYQPSETKLTSVSEFTSGMDSIFTACMLKGYLYVFNRNKKVFCLNISDKNSTWTRIADMRYDHGTGPQCTAFENSIFVGGENKMERYDTDEKWEDINLDENVCHGSCLVCHDDCVFLIGGLAGCAIDNVAKFPLSSSTWMPAKSMNIAKYDASATIFDSKIYVAGGLGCNQGKLHDFEMYDDLTDLWTILPKMNIARYYFSLRLVDNQIFAIGDHEDLNCSIEVYDSKNKKWVTHDNDLSMKIQAAATVAGYISIE